MAYRTVENQKVERTPKKRRSNGVKSAVAIATCISGLFFGAIVANNYTPVTIYNIEENKLRTSMIERVPGTGYLERLNGLEFPGGSLILLDSSTSIPDENYVGKLPRTEAIRFMYDEGQIVGTFVPEGNDTDMGGLEYFIRTVPNGLCKLGQHYTKNTQNYTTYSNMTSDNNLKFANNTMDKNPEVGFNNGLILDKKHLALANARIPSDLDYSLDCDFKE